MFDTTDGLGDWFDRLIGAGTVAWDRANLPDNYYIDPATGAVRSTTGDTTRQWMFLLLAVVALLWAMKR